MPDAAPVSTPQVSPNGAITGIDGMLDQVSGSLVRQAQDAGVPAEVGAAIGREIARPLWLLAGVVTGYVVYKVATRRR